jgi:hypothetical protein
MSSTVVDSEKKPLLLLGVAAAIFAELSYVYIAFFRTHLRG